MTDLDELEDGVCVVERDPSPGSGTVINVNINSSAKRNPFP